MKKQTILTGAAALALALFLTACGGQAPEVTPSPPAGPPPPRTPYGGFRTYPVRSLRDLLGLSGHPPK